MATQADTIEAGQGSGSSRSTPEQARKEIEAGDAVLIDTREPHESSTEAHIDGAELIPPPEVAERIDEVAPDRSQRA